MNIDAISKSASSLIKSTKLPISFAAQGDGVPDDDQGWKFKGKNPLEQYLNQARKWSDLGVQIIGGCCGTSPDYISKLHKQFSVS